MTIDELLAIEEIRTVRYLYGHYLDSGEIEKMVALFTDDGVAEWPEHMGGHWKSKQQMFENWSKVFNDRARPFDRMHMWTNPYIRLTAPDMADGRFYMVSMRPFEEDGSKVIGTLGVHDDIYKKIDGKWYMHRTRMDFLYPFRNYEGPRIPY